jgi:predicted dehydrogenase
VWQGGSITRSIGVGMLGYGFMGRAHSRALQELRRLDVPLRPELVSVAGRDREALERFGERWGWREAVTDWREQVADERVQLFVNGGPNALHAEPCIAAVRNGKHVLCEKPLGLGAEESHRMWQEAERGRVRHLAGFNYRFVPAVRLARELVEGGELGDVVHFRACYLQSWGWEADESAWRFDRAQAGTGALGDLGTHVIDLARYLVGEITSVSALVRTFVAGREVDDHVVVAVEFESGVAGTLEASRLARGRLNSNAFELNGSQGSLAFDAERLNELQVADAHGFKRVLVTEPGHPFMRFWWPPGHIVGWGETFVHELAHLLEAIAGEHAIEPHGATFEDGYRCDAVVEAILRSAETRQQEEVRLP